MSYRITQAIITLAFCIGITVTGCNSDKRVLNVQTAAESVENRYGVFSYEICSDGGREYVVLTGIKEGCKRSRIPNNIHGIPVEEIGDEVFKGIDLSEKKLPETLRKIGDCAFQDAYFGQELLCIPKGVEWIGESAFENCGLRRVEFEGEESPAISKRAFADNELLWAVYVPTGDCSIADDAFVGCDEDFYIAYDGEMGDEENLVEEYAAEHGMTAARVFEIDSMEPVVRYPEEPLVLTPEIRNFFYGENADNDNFCSMEYADDAPDYGFDEWHAPCGEFCAGEGFLELEASSELASSEDRYAVEHVCTGYGREYAWAEGVEGSGIGESITYHDGNQWNITNRWDGLVWEHFEHRSYPMDGYIRYTEICIVNGYAKNQKTWEENGRVKRLLMYVEDKPYAYLELEDTIYPQYFELPWEDIMSVDGGEITFRFVIEDVYPGILYNDTCLTGLVVEFTGRHGH